MKKNFVFSIECASIVTLWSVLPFLYQNYAISNEPFNFMVHGAAYFSTIFSISLLWIFLLNASLTVIPFEVKGRTRQIVIVILSVCFLMYVTIDACVYSLYRNHLDETMVRMVMDESIVQLGWKVKLEVAIVFFVYLVLITFSLNSVLIRKIGGVTSIFFGLLFVAFNLSYSYCRASGNPVLESGVEMTPMCRPLRMSKFWNKMGVINNNEQVNFVSLGEKVNTLQYPLEKMVCGKPKMNVLFIIVDALRADVVNLQNTPNLSLMAKEQGGIKFLNHYSGGHRTQQGVFSIFYSLPGSYWHSVWNGRVSPVMLDVLQENGYDVRAYASAPLTNPDFVNTIFVKVKGIRSVSKGDSPVERDLVSLREFKEWIAARNEKEKPFFSLIFLDAPHGYSLAEGDETPYVPTWKKADYTKLGKNYDGKEYFNLYKNAVFNADKRIGDIISLLKKKGIYDSTLIVLTGDHGEEFNDNGLNYWGHAGNFSAAQTHVPLVIHWPGMKGGEYNHLTTSYDLVPTILSRICDCKNDFRTYSIGRDLFEETERPFFTSFGHGEQACIEKNRIVVRLPSGRLLYKDKSYRDSSDTRLPECLSSMIEEGARFRKN